jgi:RNA-directed DNA polymerase
MSGNALQQLATLDNLRKEWNTFWVKARRQTVQGVDGISPPTFEKSLTANLETIRRSLLEGYQFSALVALPFPKPNGKDRIICVPTVADRLVQRAIGSRLRRYHDRLGINNDSSFGFLPSTKDGPKGVKAARDRAISLRRKSPFAYKSDISSFFDSIPRSDLADLIDRAIPTGSLRTLIKGAMSCEIQTSRADIARKVENAQIIPGKGVRQGMPLSPFFANLILRDFDKVLIKKGYQLVRYADDFLVLARSKDECLEIDAVARRLLADQGFRIPLLDEEKSKTQIRQPMESVDFLGLSLEPDGSSGYQLAFTEQQIDEIRRKLYRYKTLDEARRSKLDISTLGKMLDAAVAGYRAAYPADLVSNFSRLDDTLTSAKITVFGAIFRDLFGAGSLNRLNTEQRAFLCLGPT